MVLSNADKKEIAAMFQAFTEAIGPGRPYRTLEEDVPRGFGGRSQYRTPEEKALDILMSRLVPAAEAFGYRMGPGRQAIPFEERVVGGAFETAFVPSKRKKAMTKFNRAVKKGMEAVKASTSYGKKGTISNSKKAFSAVTKTVSKAHKKQKAPKKGVLKKVFTAAAKILATKASPKTRVPGRAKTFRRKDYRDYDPQGTMFD